MTNGIEHVANEPTIARIWRARTRREDADAYEPYLRLGGIPPLRETALGFELFREVDAAIGAPQKLSNDLSAR